MSAVIIIKNIFEFAKILSSASRDDVEKWNKVSIQNALNWSEYCEEIYKHVIGQDFEDDVNQKVNQLTLFLEPVSCIRLSTESLGKAKYLLVETLLSNPKFPLSSKFILRDIIQEKSECAWILRKFDDRWTQLKTYSQVCQEVLNETETIERDANLLFGNKAKCEAKTLMQHLVVSMNSSEKLERFTKYCKSLCDKLSESNEGWAIIVCLFCTIQDLDEETSARLTDVQRIILNWFKMQDISSSKLWLLDVKLLVQASCDNADFFLMYLQILLLWADTFTPVIDKGSNFTWRSSSGHTTDSLTEHFRMLFLALSPSYEERKCKALDAVVDKVTSTDFTVWHVLAQSLANSLRDL
ncbi:hypothetical protein BgiMline_022896 [Biomphalaria glabrata]|nr:fanconi anemia group F protein [Biomphalaria glabrata]